MQTSSIEIDLEAEFRSYVDTALWSSSVEEDFAAANDCAPDVSLQSYGFGPDDIDSAALDTMRADLADFIDGAPADALAFWVDMLGVGQIGHDFWLTRNGHGAGFWDRFAAVPGYDYGKALTAEAKPYGESYLYVGDDGLIYVS